MANRADPSRISLTSAQATLMQQLAMQRRRAENPQQQQRDEEEGSGNNPSENQMMQRIIASMIQRRYQRNQSQAQESDNSSEESEDIVYRAARQRGNSGLIQLHPKLPLEWKDIEEDPSEIGLEIFQQLGPLALLLFTRIQKLKILTSQSISELSLHFLKPVLDYYDLNSKKALSEPIAAKNLNQLLSIVPDLGQIKIGLKYKERKENIVYRIVIEVVGSYLKDYDGPSYKKYTKKFLPLAIKFYEGLSTEEVEELNEIMKEISGADILKNIILKKTSRKAYIQFYENELQTLSNLREGLEYKNYII